MSVVLLGKNTYTGGTDICNCGTLQLGDATHMASIVGDVVNNNVFNIVNADTSEITSITNNGGTTTFLRHQQRRQGKHNEHVRGGDGIPGIQLLRSTP